MPEACVKLHLPSLNNTLPKLRDPHISAMWLPDQRVNWRSSHSLSDVQQSGYVDEWGEYYVRNVAFPKEHPKMYRARRDGAFVDGLGSIQLSQASIAASKLAPIAHCIVAACVVPDTIRSFASLANSS